MEGRCPNCAQPSVGRYCPSCGQDNAHRRLQLRTVLRTTVGSLFGLESRLVRTLCGLLRDPGELATAYGSGHRARYVNPARFCLLSLAAWFLANSVFGIDPFEASGLNVTASSGGESARKIEHLRGALAGKLDILLYVSLPFYALALRVLCRRRDRNSAEILAVVLFLEGLNFLLACVLTPLTLVPGVSSVAIRAVRAVLYIAWTIRAVRTFFGLSLPKAIGVAVAGKIAHVFSISILLAFIVIPWLVLTA